MAELSARCGTLRRMLVIWLVLFAACPLTAPFSTLDLSATGTDWSLDAPKAKTGNDACIPAPIALPGVVADVRPLHVSAAGSHRRSRHAQHIVLRL